MTVDDGRNLDRPVNRELRLSALLLPFHRLVQRLNCTADVAPTCEQEPEIIKRRKNRKQHLRIFKPQRDPTEKKCEYVLLSKKGHFGAGGHVGILSPHQSCCEEKKKTLENEHEQAFFHLRCSH